LKNVIQSVGAFWSIKKQKNVNFTKFINDTMTTTTDSQHPSKTHARHLDNEMRNKLIRPNAEAAIVYQATSCYSIIPSSQYGSPFSR